MTVNPELGPLRWLTRPGRRPLRRLPGYLLLALTAVMLLAAAGCSTSSSSYALTSGHGPKMLLLRSDTTSVTNVPNCSWALFTARGKRSSDETGLIRCYLRALASGNVKNLRPLVFVGSGETVYLTREQFRDSAAIRTGRTVARFDPNPDDSSDATVHLDFPDGVSSGALVTVAASSRRSVWRGLERCPAVVPQ